MKEVKTEVPGEGETPEVEPQKEVVTLNKEDYDKYVADSQAKENLVDEIKDLREKKQLAETERDDAIKKVEDVSKIPAVETAEITPEKVNEMINQGIQTRLSEQETADTEHNKQEAIQRFKESHKEFHEDNDEGGLKYSSLERELKVFNTGSARSVDDFLSLMEKARTFIKKEEQPQDTPETPYSETPANESVVVPAQGLDDKNLTPKELKLITNSFGGNKQKYLEQKAKRPDYVAQLLSYIY